jgi:hypothetical protein
VDIAIVQGQTWESVQFFYPGDLSGGTARGQIRTDYLSRSGRLLAEFEFLPLVYGLVTSVTIVTPSPRTIIAPKLDRDRTIHLPIPTTNLWVYDIFVDIGTRSIQIGEGKVSVKPRVTE